MYTIAEVIFGILPTPEIRKFFNEFEPSEEPEDPDTEWFSGDPEEFGWERSHSGSAIEDPMFFGVGLGQFDECSNGEDIDDLTHPVNMQPSAEQRAKALEKIAKFAKESGLTLPEPKRWIMWSTS